MIHENTLELLGQTYDDLYESLRDSPEVPDYLVKRREKAHLERETDFQSLLLASRSVPTSPDWVHYDLEPS